jgi:tRNA C32,U32 (ribose-2'-O)-methylase TrmJ
MKSQEELTLDYLISIVISGGVYSQIAQALATQYAMPKDKNEVYLKNKLRTSVSEINKIMTPFERTLTKYNIKARPEINKLVDMVTDVASLEEHEYKRVMGIFEKIKQERRKNYVSN